ncbi:hypothetical protein LOTGIDRAFT_153217 [Lottia gigantea]|uniref:Uncharacterized protein n=1 Tax=Lottia gigantea TaxID=225164 RepID=V4AJK4_LOTGI|nr:hypothetical protein LOTGIDRAFT_153217 [Lottia gigantea]ESO93756.1 hypothetical protein LOTGIDRAFT_153217 [Lottia gigantea]
MSRLTPYRVFEVTVFFCVVWTFLTTLCWTWFLWTDHMVKSSDISTVQEYWEPVVRLESDLLFEPLRLQNPLTRVSPRPKVTPVYIVEEHHEVLTYWYNAANRGLLPTQNNTLFHIDAHQDGASPENWQAVPFFRFPVSEHEIRLMMQQNDAFIFESVITGFINRWIYVFSSWDPEQKLEDDYLIYTKYIGAYTMASENKTNAICECDFEEEQRYCMLQIGDRESQQSIEIPPDHCDIKRIVKTEYMSEQKAIELLKTTDWLSPTENLVLDIDEDFYGCEASCMPLYDVGILEPEIQMLKGLIARIFCPMNTLQERKLDQIFYRLTQRFIGWKPNNQNKTKFLQEKKEFIEIVIKEVETVVDMNKVQKCHRNTLFRAYLRMLLKKFEKYTDDQLRALGEVGLCLGGTPKAAEFEYQRGARICDGYNRPNESMVYFHTPTVQEIIDRTIQLGEILQLLPEPDVVTICRSMRDGYTPRKFFHKIEHDVLKLLEDNFEKVTNDSVHYDNDLLGGRYGWPDRHEV